MLHTFMNSYFYSATFSPARLRDYIFLYSVNRTFCLLWFADLSCQLQCRSAADPGSFYLVPGSHHQIFCYITLKNTPYLFDSFYSVFFKVTFQTQDDCLPIQQPISTFLYKRGKKIMQSIWTIYLSFRSFDLWSDLLSGTWASVTVLKIIKSWLYIGIQVIKRRFNTYYRGVHSFLKGGGGK